MIGRAEEGSAGEISVGEPCLKPPAPTAATLVKYLSGQAVIGRFTAVIASKKWVRERVREDGETGEVSADLVLRTEKAVTAARLMPA